MSSMLDRLKRATGDENKQHQHHPSSSSPLPSQSTTTTEAATAERQEQHHQHASNNQQQPNLSSATRQTTTTATTRSQQQQQNEAFHQQQEQQMTYHHHHHHHQGNNNVMVAAQQQQQQQLQPQPMHHNNATAAIAMLFRGADKYNIADYLEIVPQPIGRGAFSEVFQAIVKPTRQVVAVKVVPKVNLAKGGEQLQAEVQLMKMVDHPNLVKLICLFEDAVNVYLVLELLTGGELFHRITTIYPQGYPEYVASETVKQILKGIQHLHERNIIHRDLKPENLLYVSRTSDTNIKITDFGLAKLITEDKLALSQCGSPSYVAPEVLAGKPYAHAVDMWSLGVLSYVLLCGFAPFYHPNAKKLFEIIQTGKYHFPSPYFDKVSEDGKDFIRKLLVVNAADRWTANQALGHQWICSPPQPHNMSLQEATLPGTERRQWQHSQQMRATTVADGPTTSPATLPEHQEEGA